MKSTRGYSIPFLQGQSSISELPLYRQIYRRVLEGVLSGAIAPGARLPSARAIAGEEGISRNTVEAAYGQLEAEGFVVRRVGSGTWVSEDLPEHVLAPRSRRIPDLDRTHRVVEDKTLSDRGRELVALRRDPDLNARLPFAPCLPGAEASQFGTWSRIVAKQLRRTQTPSASSHPAGLPALRKAVAGYLHMHRGVRCTTDQVVILNSTQQAINLATHVLLNPNDEVWLEDPGYLSARRAFLNGGIRVRPIPVDEEGLIVACGEARAPKARMAYVTPSHQYPMGVTLSIARRLELLNWSERAGSWIFEDDYDSELRHRGRPLASLQGIDTTRRVLYAGTFNKLLPPLRIAYLVLPQQLVEPFVRAKEVTDGATSPFLQAALADFIAQGHFSAHLRRVRELCRKRRDCFMSAAQSLHNCAVRVGPTDAGMHVAIHLPTETNDVRFAERAQSAGVATPALSSYALSNPVRGLLVHYGNTRPNEIEQGVQKLQRLLRRGGLGR